MIAVLVPIPVEYPTDDIRWNEADVQTPVNNNWLLFHINSHHSSFGLLTASTMSDCWCCLVVGWLGLPWFLASLCQTFHCLTFLWCRFSNLGIFLLPPYFGVILSVVPCQSTAVYWQLSGFVSWYSESWYTVFVLSVKFLKLSDVSTTISSFLCICSKLWSGNWRTEWCQQWGKSMPLITGMLNISDRGNKSSF